MIKRKRRPQSPGYLLKTHYLDPRGITIEQLSTVIRIHEREVKNVTMGFAPITAMLAVRLAAALDTTPEFWLNLQNAFDIYDEELILNIHPIGKIEYQHTVASETVPTGKKVKCKFCNTLVAFGECCWDDRYRTTE